MPRRNRNATISKALLAVLALTFVAFASRADAATQGRVKGVVTLDGQPLAGAKVTLVREDEEDDIASPATTVTTDTAGSYSILIPKDRSFVYRTVVVTDPRHRAVSTSRDFAVRPTRAVTRNVTTKPAGTMTGEVTRAGRPVSGRTTVSIEGPDPYLPSVLVDSFDTIYDDRQVVGEDGVYRFVGLPAGTYTVCFTTDSTYLRECYDDAVEASPSSARASVSVTGGATTALDDQVLDHRPAHVTGLVTDTAGKPVPYLTVQAFDVGSSDPYVSAGSPEPGTYDLMSGTANHVQLRLQSYNYETRWYDSARRSDAQVLSLAEGTRVENRTIALRSKARIIVTAKPGTGKATFSIEVIRRATKHHPGGRVTVARKDVSRTLDLHGGRATVTLKGIQSGVRTFTVDFLGTPSTAPTRKTVKVRIG